MTGRGARQVAGARRVKVMVAANPAEAPTLMRNTVSCMIDSGLDEPPMCAAIDKTAMDTVTARR